MFKKRTHSGLTLSLAMLLTSVSIVGAAEPQVHRLGTTPSEGAALIQRTNHIGPYGPGHYGTVAPQGSSAIAQAGVVSSDFGEGWQAPPYAQRYSGTAGYKSFTRTPGGRIYPTWCAGDCDLVQYDSKFSQATWNFRARNYAASQRLACRNRYFLSGRLFWWDMGARKEIIAVDPGYSDQRDHEMYATQAYGVPMAVPLAPVVRDSYNYGWGLPSSRLTPVATTPVP